MGLQWAEHTIEIDASPDEVFDAITDYDTFPSWQSAVLEAHVETREKRSKLGETVKYAIDGKVRTVHYTLKYRYDRPESITWDFVEGSGINNLQGGYSIEASGGGTKATYKVGIDVSGVPGPVLKRVHKGTVKQANEDLKAEAERRHRSGEATAEHDVPAGGEDDFAGSSTSSASGSGHPFDLLPGPAADLAKLPGKIMVKVGKRLGG